MPKARPAVSVGDLVRTALLKAAASDESRLTGKDGGLFVSSAGANKEAIGECLSAEEPLLAVVRTEGKSQFVALTPAGYGRIAGELPDERAGSVARGVAAALPPRARVEFIQEAIRRTPLAAAELLPLLEEAVEAEKSEHQARVAAAAVRRTAEDAAKKALERAVELLEERRQNRLNALRREWEVEGGRGSDLPAPGAHQGGTPPGRDGQPRPGAGPSTGEERDFRRDVAKQLAEAWRAAWEANRQEAREYLESAMWNISGLKLLGEAGEGVAFSGRYHEGVPGAFNGDPVRIARPGWALEEADDDFIVLKAAVEK